MDKRTVYKRWVIAVSTIVALAAMAIIGTTWSTNAQATSGLETEIQALTDEIAALSSENAEQQARIDTIEVALNNTSDIDELASELSEASAAITDIETEMTLGDEHTATDDRKIAELERLVDVHRLINQEQDSAIEGAYAAADNAYSQAVADSTNAAVSQVYGSIDTLVGCINGNFKEIANKWGKVTTKYDIFNFAQPRLYSC